MRRHEIRSLVNLKPLRLDHDEAVAVPGFLIECNVKHLKAPKRAAIEPGLLRILRIAFQPLANKSGGQLKFLPFEKANAFKRSWKSAAVRRCDNQPRWTFRKRHETVPVPFPPLNRQVEYQSQLNQLCIDLLTVESEARLP